MRYTILIPFWGNDPRYVKLLHEWFQAYYDNDCAAQVVVVYDQDTEPVPGYSWTKVSTPEWDQQYPFDHKGDIVCAAIQRFLEPVLVLDSDAILRKDPTVALTPFYHKEFAMPADEGALGRQLRNRHAQEIGIAKRCAGVLWFGPGNRAKLVDEYRQAFVELLSGRYYEERRLFEQHAWSWVAHQRNAPFLPRTMNWADHNSRNGPNPEAFIYHRIGQRKFNLRFSNSQP